MIKRYKCVVVANGLFPTGQQALELLRQAEFVVACDGAVIGLENGRLPDAVVGDLDSLPEPVRNRYSDRIHRVKDQETNDLTKAVNPKSETISTRSNSVTYWASKEILPKV